MSNIVLTQETFEKQLQIYGACAVKKGALYIENLKKGIECSELFSDATLMIGLIKSIECFDISITSCVSNDKIQIILNKLKALCSLSWEDVINFRSGCLSANQGGGLLANQGGRICPNQNYL